MLGLVWVFAICPVAAIMCVYAPISIAKKGDISVLVGSGICLLVGFVFLNEHPLFWLLLPTLIYIVWYVCRGHRF